MRLELIVGSLEHVASRAWHRRSNGVGGRGAIGNGRIGISPTLKARHASRRTTSHPHSRRIASHRGDCLLDPELEREE